MKSHLENSSKYFRSEIDSTQLHEDSCIVTKQKVVDLIKRVDINKL
jgi:hypothetical protein